MKEILQLQVMPNGETIEVITVIDGNTAVSMLKSTWDELQAAKEAQSL